MSFQGYASGFGVYQATLKTVVLGYKERDYHFSIDIFTIVILLMLYKKRNKG